MSSLSQIPPIVDTPQTSSTKRWYILPASLAALAAGLTASFSTSALMVLLRITLGIPTPVELFGDHVLKLLPAPRFVDLLVKFSPNSKTAPLGLALLGMIALGTVLGLLFALLARVNLPAQGYRPSRRSWIVAGCFSLLMTIVAILLFWGEIGQSFIGLPRTLAMAVTSFALLLDFGLYGLVLCLAYSILLPKQTLEQTPTVAQKRRQLLSRAGIAALAVGSAGATAGLVKEFLQNYSFYDGMETFTHNGFVAPITPNSEHYTVTQNVSDPNVDIALWRLEVTGLIGQSGTYTYEQLQQLPSISRAVTLECIANGIGGHLMSTAIWQGVLLRELLSKHGGALPGARYIAFYSVDGYAVSLPMDEVLAADPILAWRMNGEVLPHKHGYPLRVLIPGRFGEESPKWLTRIELTDHFVKGLYADQGWYNGQVHTVTRIDRPYGRIPANRTVEIGGVAYAGIRGIQQVEVSVDGGLTWNKAQLAPPLSQDTWVFWTWQWQPTQPGQYTLVARATDGTGQLQTDHKQGTVPNGATGYATVSVQVG